ncbi:hypothetical protein OS493_007007 [Desmophyllum pertusum]|uniref:Uncharacterized protein n=1 Tax=Desmophyllum pertusum TaxID=174260 RepID=A0A9W9ZFD7_9CNID|nr:hypothetical protein OS493_007007 [Desmophyllum pertusum]
MKLQLVSGGKCFAGITVDLNILLSDLREKIKTEVQELMPSSFQFLYKNILLGANQESQLKLLHCVEKSNILHFKEQSDLGHGTTALDTWLKQSKPAAAKTESNFDKKREATEKITSLSQHSKLHTFSDDEIVSHPCWLERGKTSVLEFES